MEHITEKEKAPETATEVAAAVGSLTDKGVAPSPTVEKALVDTLKKEDKAMAQPSASVATEEPTDNTLAQQATSQARTPGREKSPDKKEKTHDKHKSRYTTGEKIYDQINFWIIKGLILVAGFALAIPMKFGRSAKQAEELGKMANPLRKWGEIMAEKWAIPVMKKGFALEEKIGGKLGTKVREAFTILGFGTANSTILWFGGTSVAPVVRWFENSRKELVHKWNKKWGKPGDVEIGDEKFKDLPKQSWGDVMKGRMMAWISVTAAFIVLYPLIGTSKKAGLKEAFRLDIAEEKFARWMSGFKEKIAGIPLGGAGESKKDLMRLHEEVVEKGLVKDPGLAADKWKMFRYHAGRILTLDFFATSAAIVIWNTTSRLSAAKREHGGTMWGGFKGMVKELFHGKSKKPDSAALPLAAAREDAPEGKIAPYEAAEAMPAKSFSSRTKAPEETHAATVKNRDGGGTQLSTV